MKANLKDWPTGEIYNRKIALDVGMWLHFGKYATFDGAEVYMKFRDSSPAESALIPAEFANLDIRFEDIRFTMAVKWWVSQGPSHRATKSLYPMARIWTSDEWGYSDRYLLAYWLQHKTFSGAAVHIWPVPVYPPCEDEGDTEWDWHVYEQTRE